MARKERSPAQREAELEQAAISELEKLAPPDPVPFVLSSGETVQVAPVVGEQFGDFARAVSPIRKPAQAAAESGMPEESDEDFLELLNDHQANVYATISLCTGLPEQDVADLEPGDLLWLWQISMRLNRDFFTRSLLAASVRNRKAIRQLFDPSSAADDPDSSHQVGSTLRSS